MLRLSILSVFVLLSFVAVVSAVPGSPENPVAIDWCSGTPQFRGVSGILWQSSPASPSYPSSTSSFAYSFCSAQSRVLADLNSARLQVKNEDVIFNLCSSRMDCLRRSLAPRPDGLFCIEGNVAWDFPVFASPNLDTDVTVRLIDTQGKEMGTFCARY